MLIYWKKKLFLPSNCLLWAPLIVLFSQNFRTSTNRTMSLIYLLYLRSYLFFSLCRVNTTTGIVTVEDIFCCRHVEKQDNECKGIVFEVFFKLNISPIQRHILDAAKQALSNRATYGFNAWMFTFSTYVTSKFRILISVILFVYEVIINFLISVSTFVCKKLFIYWFDSTAVVSKTSMSIIHFIYDVKSPYATEHFSILNYLTVYYFLVIPFTIVLVIASSQKVLKLSCLYHWYVRYWLNTICRVF